MGRDGLLKPSRLFEKLASEGVIHGVTVVHTQQEKCQKRKGTLSGLGKHVLSLQICLAQGKKRRVQYRREEELKATTYVKVEADTQGTVNFL